MGHSELGFYTLSRVGFNTADVHVDLETSGGAGVGHFVSGGEG